MALFVREGYVAFRPDAAADACRTWYKIVGDLAVKGNDEEAPRRPLLMIHGGPGSGHQGLLPMIDLYTQHRITLIFYDQLGCGNSTHLDSMAGDHSFWVPSLFVKELSNLVEHLHIGEYDVFGTSWGAVLAAKWAGETSPRGLRRLILQSGPASMPERYNETLRLVDELPAAIRTTILRCRDDGDSNSEKFRDAVATMIQKHVCRSFSHEQAKQVVAKISQNSHVYQTMYGSTFLDMSGTLKHLDNKETAQNISVPTLLINGEYDATTDACMKPYFQNIPKVKWITVADASHMIMVEKREKFMQICADFLL